jgi:ribosomal protein L37E
MPLYNWQCVGCFNTFRQEGSVKDIWIPCNRCGMRAMKIEPSRRKREIAIDNKICVLCGNPAQGFREIENSIEYLKSGLCQSCQDSNPGPEDRR